MKGMSHSVYQPVFHQIGKANNNRFKFSQNSYTQTTPGCIVLSRIFSKLPCYFFQLKLSVCVMLIHMFQCILRISPYRLRFTVDFFERGFLEPTKEKKIFTSCSDKLSLSFFVFIFIIWSHYQVFWGRFRKHCLKVLRDLIWGTCRLHQFRLLKFRFARNYVETVSFHKSRPYHFKFCKDWRPATLLKKRLQHRCFPVNFAKFLRTPFLRNTSGRLLLFVLTPRKFTIKLLLFSLWGLEGSTSCVQW